MLREQIGRVDESPCVGRVFQLSIPGYPFQRSQAQEQYQEKLLEVQLDDIGSWLYQYSIVRDHHPIQVEDGGTFGSDQVREVI